MLRFSTVWGCGEGLAPRVASPPPSCSRAIRSWCSINICGITKEMNECTWDDQRLNQQWPHTYSSAHWQFKVLAPILGVGTAT